MRELRVGVVGATGAVGRTMVRILEERGLPIAELVEPRDPRLERRAVRHVEPHVVEPRLHLREQLALVRVVQVQPDVAAGWSPPRPAPWKRLVEHEFFPYEPAAGPHLLLERSSRGQFFRRRNLCNRNQFHRAGRRAYQRLRAVIGLLGVLDRGVLDLEIGELQLGIERQ